MRRLLSASRRAVRAARRTIRSASRRVSSRRRSKTAISFYIVERCRLDPATLALRRDFVAVDLVYYTDEYVGYDVVLPADVPHVAHRCDEVATRN